MAENVIGTLICQAPGHPNDRHYHLRDEWWIVLEGEIDWEMEGRAEPIHARAGDFVFAPANVFHHIHVRGDRPENVEYSGAAARLTDVWVAVRAALREILEHTTLADLRDGTLPERVTTLTHDPEAWVSLGRIRGARPD